GDLSVSISGVNAGATVSAVADNNDGTYTLTYTPTKSGTDNIAITLGGAATSGSPYTSEVTHASLAKIALAGEVTDLASGTTRELTATLQDDYDNTITTGSESEYVVTFTLGGDGSASNFGPVAANNGVATVTITGEDPGNVTVLAIIPTVPPLVTNPLMFIVTVDKTELLAAIDEAGDLTESDYSPASWLALESSLTGAVAMNDNADATQSEIDAAEQALQLGMGGLTVDKTALQSAIDEAGDLTETDYSPASWTALESVLTAAVAVNDNADASQSEVDAAEQAL